MELPYSDPVGLRVVPETYQERPRSHSGWMRLMSGVLAAVFTAVVVVTSAISFGAYCLTSDGANPRGLPVESRSD